MTKYLFASVLVLFTIFSCSTSKVEQDVSTKEIKISDYNSIVIYSSAEVFYEQRIEANPYLTVEIDDKFMEHLDISVKDEVLKIRLKNENNISPSIFRIITNSKEIKHISTIGAGDFEAKNKINTEELELIVKGSGDIKIAQLEAALLKGIVEGSGDIDIKIAKIAHIEGQVRGSGDLELAGTAKTANYFVRGSGDIDAKHLIHDDVICNINGSGDITVHVEDNLTAKIYGSGDIEYRGEANLIKDIKGSGNISKIR